MIADLIHEIGQGLNRNRTRTFLTGLAVVWGIFMLCVLLGLARGVINSFEQNMGARDYRTLTIWGGITVYPYRGYDAGRRIKLRDSDMEPVAKENTRYVDKMLPLISNDTITLSTGLGYVSGITGAYPGQLRMESFAVDRGRFINERDIEELRKVVVLPEKKAVTLFGSPEKALGKYINGGGMAWLVIGTYAHNWRDNVYVPYTTLRMINGGNTDIGTLNIAGHNLNDEADAEAFQDGVIATLARLHNFDVREGRGGGIWLSNRFENYLSSSKAMSMLVTAMWVIGLLTLLTGIVGISNIMFVSVKERTHEIGIRRAIGAKPRDILTSVVCEAVAITLIFGYIGIVTGLGATRLIVLIPGSEQVLLNPGITLTMAVEVTLMLVVAGAVAGVFPAFKATKVKPVEALRDE